MEASAWRRTTLAGLSASMPERHATTKAVIPTEAAMALAGLVTGG